ncbi:uncharacterized protein LOC132265510 [Phlebotomus argentipes]|uniref:uncharacterized protein LOC132265510 n=1 Tax=Phlebotomus argentipes TaxID=94469 RepID=UPI002892AB35|nr:uncharacterized protein LOC132265510 [Phlebotomus argentipes]
MPLLSTDTNPYPWPSDAPSDPLPLPPNVPTEDQPHPPRDDLMERLRQALQQNAGRNNEWPQPSYLPKLPPIKLQKFSGKENDWQTFIELFTSVIHDNRTLGGVQKMQYLISNLEGPPRKMISHLALSNTNYQSAMAILKARYENKRLMVGNYMNSIVQFKRLNGGSAEDVIKLHDCINACMAGLRNLGYNVSSWDPMIVTIAMQKFDSDTIKAFEENISDVTAVPTIAELLQFLLKRFRILRSAPREYQQKDYKKKSFHTTTSDSNNCSKCDKDHPLIKCPAFKKMSPYERKQHTKDHSLCFNCLYHDKNEECKSKKSCFVCKKKHHTLLHVEQKKDSSASHHTSVPDAVQEEDVNATDAVAMHIPVLVTPETTTENAAQALQLPRQKASTSIKGIGDVKTTVCKNIIDLVIAPRFPSNNKWYTKALVLPKLSSFLPTKPVESLFTLHKEEKLVLADPRYDTPGSIDVIIGTQLYAQIIKNNIKRDNSGLIAQDTQLGWIILGNSFSPSSETEVSCLISLAEIDHSLRTFWEIDVEDSAPTQQQQECVAHYEETHSRTNDGRYQVRLPFIKNSQFQLGESRGQAVARFLSMEKKFAKDPQLKKDYSQFVHEYLELAHMTPVPTYSGPSDAVYYLPHHAVFKADSTTTKTRVIIPEELRELRNIQFKGDEIVKSLGIYYNPLRDAFQFTVKLRPKEILTKRGITSESASIFDPIGWLAPVILRAKIIIQMLWKEEVGWDQKPAEVIINRWKDFRNDITAIEEIRIPRWTQYTPQSRVELHGFADASEKAFAACIYIRVTTGKQTTVHLLTAKTRVAPQKGKITLPRLELCGAVLLAQLLKRTESTLKIPIHAVFAWSDSEITLACV